MHGKKKDDDDNSLNWRNLFKILPKAIQRRLKRRDKAEFAEDSDSEAGPLEETKSSQKSHMLGSDMRSIETDS